MNTPASNNGSKNVLNSDVELKGTLKFSGELTFDGKLDGDINTDGTLNLGDNAVVKGNLNVSSVIMRGNVNGNVAAKEKIDIKSKTELFGDMRGKINGNITAREKIEIESRTEHFGDIRSARLVMEDGVTFVGQTEVNPNKTAPTPPRPTEPAR